MLVADSLTGRADREEAPEQFQIVKRHAKFVDEALAFRDIAYGAPDHSLSVYLHRAETDLSGKFSAILTASKKLYPAFSHEPDSWIIVVACAVMTMAGTKTRGDKDFHLLPQQLFPPIAEQLFTIAVHHHDPAIVICQHHSVRDRFEEHAHELLRIPYECSSNTTHSLRDAFVIKK